MLTGVVTFLLLLIALLAIPITLTFQLSRQQAFQGDIRLLWLFGLVRVQFPSFKAPSPISKKKEPTKKSKPARPAAGNISNIVAIIWQQKFRLRIMKFISDVWHALRKKDLSLRIHIGLGDPADTGQLWAVVGPVAGILANVQEATIEIEPEFFAASFELDSSGNIRLIPLQLIYLTVALLLSPPIWQGAKLMRVVKK